MRLNCVLAFGHSDIRATDILVLRTYALFKPLKWPLYLCVATASIIAVTMMVSKLHGVKDIFIEIFNVKFTKGFRLYESINVDPSEKILELTQ